MKRFVFWYGQLVILASCRDCDYRMEFPTPADGEIILQATESHDCLRDGQ